MNAVSLPITIRPARDSDRPALEAIAARTWDGGDYLPRVLEAWLADSEGEFASAEAENGQVVGCAKLTRFGPGEWWLEGMRVDPDQYGQGLGSALTEYLVGRADALARAENQAEPGAVRLCTSATNQAVIKMMSKTGFSEGGRYRRYTSAATPTFPHTDEFRALHEGDFSMIRAFLEASAYFHKAHQSTIARRWLCHFITQERLKVWLRAGKVFGWWGRRRDPTRVEGLDGVVILAENGIHADTQPELTITYLDAIPGALAVLAQAVRGLAAQHGCQAAWQMALSSPERLVALEQAGWRRPVDNSGRAILFTRVLK